MHRVPLEFVRGAFAPASPVGLTPRRRSVVAFAALAAGMLVARSIDPLPTAMWFGAAQVLAAVALVCRGTVCKAALVVSVFLLGGGWFTLRIHDADASIRAGLAEVGYVPNNAAQPTIIRVRGLVIDPPRPTEPSRGALASFFPMQPATRFTVAAETIAGPLGERPARGRVDVFVETPAHDRSLPVRPGDRVVVTGTLTVPERPKNPGELDRRLFAAQDGVLGRLSVKSRELLRPAETDDGGAASSSLDARAWFVRAAGLLRERAGRALEALKRGGAEQTEDERAGRALLGAMLLGERDSAYDTTDRAFRRLGLVHLVAISGFNLAILAGVSLVVIRLTGERGRLEPIIVGAVVTLYMVVVPAEAPIIRSGVTVLVFLLTEAAGRRYDRLTLLAWTAVAVLLWRPLDLWSLGFQLSFGIVGVLLWLGDRATARLFGVPLRGTITPRRRGARAALRTAGKSLVVRLHAPLSTSLLAWTSAAPIVALKAGTFSPLAAISGLIVLPLTVLALWAGYLALLAGMIWPTLGEWAGPAVRPLTRLLARTVFLLDDLPLMAVSVPRLSAWWAAAATICVLAWFRWWGKRSAAAWAATALTLAWLAVQLSLGGRLASGVVARIDTLSVGDGSCHLIRSGDESLLWDCGSSNAVFGVDALPRAVRELGGRGVSAAVITHANLDHFSALPDAAAPLGVHRVYLTPAFLAAAHEHAAAGEFLRRLSNADVEVITIQAGGVIPLGGMNLEFLSPTPDLRDASANDTSLVALLRPPSHAAPGASVALFLGDLGPLGIRELLAAHPDLRADAMELPHHGSFNPDAAALLERVNPAHVLRSTGRRRAADPRWDRFTAGRAWHTTAYTGAAWVELLEDGGLRGGDFRARE